MNGERIIAAVDDGMHGIDNVLGPAIIWYGLFWWANRHRVPVEMALIHGLQQARESGKPEMEELLVYVYRRMTYGESFGEDLWIYSSGLVEEMERTGQPLDRVFADAIAGHIRDGATEHLVPLQLAYWQLKNGVVNP